MCAVLSRCRVRRGNKKSFLHSALDIGLWTHGGFLLAVLLLLVVMDGMGCVQDDESITCSVFLSRTALFSDRLVVFIGDSDGSPAGIWSARLCVRSGSEGGGIFKGSLGSMLPYVMKAKDDKLGIVLFDDVFKDSMRDGEIDVRVSLYRAYAAYGSDGLWSGRLFWECR